MKTHAQAVVIGGGLVGCSILYHLAKLGWKDSVLLERDELTSGSTWHAAAGIHGLHDNNNVSRLQYYTMQIYAELENETGQGCGIFQPGSLYLAQTREREHQLRLQAAKAKFFDVEFHELSVSEAQELHPLIDFDGIRCIMYEPISGNVDPSGVTHAYAKGARMLGADIHRFTKVEATNQLPDGRWEVVTSKGNIIADVVVNAAGLWGREVARMAGVDLPLMPMEHQYFVTETIPEVEAIGRRLPSVADRDAEYYMRQEGLGFLVGAYEKEGRFWSEKETPWDFGHELLTDDLDRISDNVMRACERFPVLAEAGIKRVINGPMIWSPDSSALYGPVPELENYYCCNGIIPGFSQSGGLGLMLAQWIVEGEPELDLFPWDLARFGHWASKAYTKARAFDCYTHRFKIHFPYEERDAGRAVKKRPLYDRQKQLGCVFGLNYGWEHPLWFAGEGVDGKETYGFERQNWFEPVGEECRNLRSGVGILDISNYAKYEVKGPGSGDWLDLLVANKVPRIPGRTVLAPMIGVRGGVAGDFTVTCVDDDHYMMFGSGMAERYHQRFFKLIPMPDGVTLQSLTDAWVGFNVAGPRSRELLQELTDTDLSNEAFRFIRSQRITVAGIPVLALRVSFTGDLGFELYTEESNQVKLYDAVLEAGARYGIKPVGGRALSSLRLEKGYGSWGREFSPEYWPHELGLERYIKLDKPEFLGRDACIKVMDQEPRYQLGLFSVEVENADASGGEPIFAPDGTAIGVVSSGAYGYTVDASIAIGAIDARYAKPGDDFSVAILGRDHPATLLEKPLYDPEGLRLRS